MSDFRLPQHLVAWSEGQVDLGRAVSVPDYVAQLVAEDQRRAEQVHARRAALAEGRSSGISMLSVDSFLAAWQTEAVQPTRERLRAAIREGRESGYSRASIEGILARSLLAAVARAA